MATNTCRDLLESLAGFVDGQAPLPRRLLLRWHLARCSDCRRYRRQLDAIVAAAGQTGATVPEERARRLADAVLAALG